MRKKHCGSIVETICDAEIMRKLIEKVTLNAYADGGEAGGDEPSSDEGDDDNTSGDNSSTVNYEDLIAKARKEEKEKQYKTIERLKGQVEAQTKEHNNDLLKIAALEKEKKAAEEKLTKAGQGDSEEVQTLKAEVETLKKEKSDLEKKVQEYESNKPASREDIEKEVRAELEAEYEVKTYKAEKMAELKDQILVPELIGGNTKEDIDKSIEAALTRSAEIKKSLGIDDKGEKKKEKRTPKTPANPSGSVGGKEISLEYLQSLDVKSKEYAEVRKQLGLR